MWSRTPLTVVIGSQMHTRCILGAFTAVLSCPLAIRWSKQQPVILGWGHDVLTVDLSEELDKYL